MKITSRSVPSNQGFHMLFSLGFLEARAVCSLCKGDLRAAFLAALLFRTLQTCGLINRDIPASIAEV